MRLHGVCLIHVKLFLLQNHNIMIKLASVVFLIIFLVGLLLSILTGS